MNHSTTSSADKDFNSTLAYQMNGAEWVLDWVEENFEPSDVFNDEELGNWATENGYVKAES
mgnify:CR=1 FL=1